MAQGMSDEGRKRLGKFIAESRIAAGFTSQLAFAQWLTSLSENEFGEPELVVKEGAINTLEAARYRNMITPDTLIAIIDSKILKHKDGTPYTFNDAVAVLRGHLEPFSDTCVDHDGVRPKG